MRKFKIGDYCEYLGSNLQFSIYDDINKGLRHGMIVSVTGFIGHDDTSLMVENPNGYTWSVKKTNLKYLYHIDEE